MDRLLRESQRVVKWFNEVAGEIMSVVIERYLLQDDGTLACEEVDIGTPTVAENVEIPFFFTINRAKDKSE